MNASPAWTDTHALDVPVRSFDESPLFVFYELTRACDLVCTHCRACAQPAADPAELKTSESKALIDQLMQFPTPPMLILTGGDPFKRADLFELIEYAIDSGLKVSITPSATPLVTRGALQRLRFAGISRIAISIDGADAETHDANRGVPGSFARSLQILREARELGIETQINTTLTPGNFDQIEAMGDRFADLGITLWSVFFLIPVGRAEAMERLNAEQCEEAFGRLWQQSLIRPYMIKTTEAPHYRRYALQQSLGGRSVSEKATRRRFYSTGVNDGKGVMFVGHSGVIHPSGFLPIVCGLFPRQNIVDVYQRSPVFTALRDSNRLEGKCRLCEFRKVCGGSRARAYAVTGNLFAQEPDCNYIPRSMQGDTRCDVE